MSRISANKANNVDFDRKRPQNNAQNLDFKQNSERLDTQQKEET